MPFTKQTKEQYAEATGTDQAKYLAAGVKHSGQAFNHLLFCYCVAEYKKSATKLKAIFIWDKFLSGIGSNGMNFSDPDAIDLGVDECGKPEIMPRIKTWIDTLKTMRATALKTNRVVRFFTTSDRKPPPHLFDEFVEAMLSRTGDTVWKDIQGRLHEDKIAHGDSTKALMKQMPKIKLELTDAGFSETATRLPTSVT